MVRIAPTVASIFALLSGFLETTPGVSAREICDKRWYQCRYKNGNHCCVQPAGPNVEVSCPSECDGTAQCIDTLGAGHRQNC
ncbi:hypothetical protein E4U21_006150 [Claviceps maximensis]|nr:hypothetical protein E4U21_006150 [Claviceps maximensis]